jgi:transcriptional regulator with GAF, ATPase, and Fis domain
MNKEHQRLENLINLATVLSQQNNYQETVRLISNCISEELQSELTLILMLNPKTNHTIKTIFKEGNEFENPKFQSAQNQISGWIIKNKLPLLTSDIKQENHFVNVEWGELPIKSVLGVPLIMEGLTIGTLILINKKGGEFNNNDILYLEKISVVVLPYLRNLQKLKEYFEIPLPDEVLLRKYRELGLLGKCKKFIELLQAIEAAARCDVRVLLEGQTGTGKELIAEAIHRLSSRRDYPFVAIDCGAIPQHLIESELFGFVKGAFTGAVQDRKGLFESAQKGTLFLDEITNLPIEIQAKLLRVSQEGEVRPIGSNASRKIDVRIITASSTSLRKLVDEDKFMEDLYYRLHVYPIYVPTLSERKDDIPSLANHFLKKFTEQQEKKAEAFHATILSYMKEHVWQGQIRELENLVERLVTLVNPEASIITADLIPSDLQREFHQILIDEGIGETKSLKELLQESEEKIIRDTLESKNWNQTKAAQALNISEQLIRYRMKKLGITRPT